MTLSLSVPGASDSPVWMTDVSIVSVTVGVCICVFVSVSTLIDVCACACLSASAAVGHYPTIQLTRFAIADKRCMCIGGASIVQWPIQLIFFLKIPSK